MRAELVTAATSSSPPYNILVNQLRPTPTLLDSFSCRLASFSPAPQLELEKKNLIRFQTPDEEKCKKLPLHGMREGSIVLIAQAP